MAAGSVIKPGPQKPKHGPPPYPPKPRRPRILIETDLPDGVRYARDTDGRATAHEFEQHDARWFICAGRGLCRICNMTEPTDIPTRLRGMIAEFYGPSFVAGVADADSLFTADGTRDGRFAGDREDREDLRMSIEVEFRIFLPDDFIATGPVSLNSLGNAVSAALADPTTRRMD